MFARNFSCLTRPTQALLVVALCGIAATVTLADNSGKHKADAQEGRSSQQEKSYDRSSKDRETPNNKTSDTGRDYNRGKDRADSTYKPGYDNRQPRRQGNDYKQPRESRNDRYGRDYPSYPYNRPKTDKQRYDYNSKPKVDVDIRIGERNMEKSRRDYLPTYRNGYYYYKSRPNNRAYRYGHWIFDDPDPVISRRSVYCNYGFFPYIDAVRVRITPYVVVSYRSNSRDGYYLSKRSDVELDDTLADIRDAWLDGRLDLITSHIRSGQVVAVLLDGRYDYSLDADDYTQMTSDAIDQIQTVNFTWESIRERTDGDYTAFGKHTYRDASGYVKTVYVSYTLRRYGRGYTITEVGSSASILN